MSAASTSPVKGQQGGDGEHSGAPAAAAAAADLKQTKVGKQQQQQQQQKKKSPRPRHKREGSMDEADASASGGSGGAADASDLQGQGSKGAKKRAKKTATVTSRARLQFSVPRVRRMMRRQMPRVSVRSAIALTAVVEYIMAEILELSARAASDNGRKRLTPRYIMLAIRYDAELVERIRGMTILGGGVMPRSTTVAKSG